MSGNTDSKLTTPEQGLCLPVGLSGELEVLGEDTQSCKMNFTPKESLPARLARHSQGQ